MDYKTADLESIIKDAKETDNVELLKSIAKKMVKNKKGEKRPISFLQLRREYFLAVHPEDMPHASKKETMWDVIGNL